MRATRFVDRIVSPLVRSAFRPEVLTDLGGFGGVVSGCRPIASAGNQSSSLRH